MELILFGIGVAMFIMVCIAIIYFASKGPLTGTEKLMSAIALLAVAVGTLTLTLWITPIVVGLLLLVAGASLRQIPAMPVSAAALTRFGSRVDGVMFKPRYIFVLPYYEDLIIQEIKPETTEIVVDKIRVLLNPLSEEDKHKEGKDQPAKESGGSVEGKVMLVYVPNTDNGVEFGKFLNSGAREGVNKIMNGVAAGALRKAGSKKTFEEFSFSKSELTVELTKTMTDKEPEDMSEEGLKKFLSDMLQNGAGDVHDLGIKIRRFEVIAIDPEGKLEEDAELAAREVQQRRAETRDIETENKLADIYMSSSKGDDDKPTITRKEALEFVRLRRNPNSKEFIIRGSSGPMADAAAIFAEGSKQ